MHRLILSVAGVALLAVCSLPSDASARRGKDAETIAVWDLIADDFTRGEAEPVYREIAESLDSITALRTDSEARFLPEIRPSEGVMVAQHSATRWLEAAWIAYQRKEWSVARSLLDDALALVEPYPHERLPEGLRHQLLLLKARTDIRGGNSFTGREAMRAAMALDPSWEASPQWEIDDVVSLYEEVRAETIGVPPARVAITASVPGATVLVGGMERGMTQGVSPLELILPPGNHEITVRKPGHASHTRTVFVTPRQEIGLDFFLEVRNTARFQELLTGALQSPRSQRSTGIWGALGLATEAVGAQGVLNGYHDADASTLHIGLFFPGRQGWVFHRSIVLDRDDTAERVEQAIDELLVTVDRALHPELGEVAGL